MKKIKVGIIGGKCFDLIVGSPVPRYTGGIETQLVALAKGLVRVDCEVSLITFDHGQADEQEIHGVRVLKSYQVAGGIPVLRVIQRSQRLWRAMRRADADVYLQMGAGFETGQAAWGCGRKGNGRKRFIFCMASDLNYGADLRAGRLGWEGRVYEYGLRRADLVLAQTVGQRDGLRQAVGVESQVVPMAVPSVEDNTIEAKSTDGPPHVLWVGRIAREKRLDWLLDIARQCPQVIFDVVGTANHSSEYAASLMREAGCLPNVKVHGRIPGPQLNRLYQTCRVLCCTSVIEGFPTTFLEAWSCGTPVITTFDPDGLVARHGLGWVAVNTGDFASHLKRILSDPDDRERHSAAARGYYESHHSVAAVSLRFRSAFEQLLATT